MLRHLKIIAEYLISCGVVAGVFAGAFFLPNAFLYINRSNAAKTKNNKSFKLGIENLSPAALKQFFLPNGEKCRVALITNQTGKDQQGNRNVDILISKGINVCSILTPKHGFYANQKEFSQEHLVDSATKIPMISWQACLTEGTNENRKLQQSDLLLFDMQDSGVRYGYAATLFEIMEVAQRYKKRVVVLDRPNLLGNSMEGMVAQLLATASTPGCSVEIPLRYGMTIGELSHYFNKYVLSQPISLHVVPMANYARADKSKNFFLGKNLSPHLQNLKSCYGYSFLGLLGEIYPFDVGLGTDKAFQCVALPESHSIARPKWHELRALLKDNGIESKVDRYYSPRKKSFCVGLTVRIQDINKFSSFSALLSVVQFFKKEQIPLKLSENFDRYVGSHKVRQFLEGKIAWSALEQEVTDGLKSFFHKAVSACIYSPLPRLMSIRG